MQRLTLCNSEPESKATGFAPGTPQSTALVPLLGKVHCLNHFPVFQPLLPIYEVPGK